MTCLNELKINIGVATGDADTAATNRVHKLLLQKRDALFVGEFRAMASPCQVLIETGDEKLARKLSMIAMREAQRIEHTFSRYRNDNIIHRINNSNGRRIKVDEETARLLDFASQCFELSEGAFDITSGVLRKVWQFDGSDRLPAAEQIEALLPLVGWQQVSWSAPYFTMPDKMQIDFGGIGKEYAVDRTVSLLADSTNLPFLVNYGGDLHANAAPESTGFWSVGIDAVKHTNASVKTVQLQSGALTTSGDAQRFILNNELRYGHVLHPATGWPVINAPSSVTVAGINCTEAGVLSTLAILNGANAEAFLDMQAVKYWCQR